MGRMKCIPCGLLYMAGKSTNCTGMRIKCTPKTGSTRKQTINASVFAQTWKKCDFLVINWVFFAKKSTYCRSWNSLQKVLGPGAIVPFVWAPLAQQRFLTLSKFTPVWSKCTISILQQKTTQWTIKACLFLNIKVRFNKLP